MCGAFTPSLFRLFFLVGFTGGSPPPFFLSFSLSDVFFLAEAALGLSRHSPLHVFLPGVEMALVYPERRRAPGVAVAARHFFLRPSLMCSPLVTRHSPLPLSCNELAENVLFS